MLRKEAKYNRGRALISFDVTTSQAELNALQKVHDSLKAETEFYRTLLDKANTQPLTEARILALNLPKNIVDLALNRTALIADNQFLRSQINGNQPDNKWDRDKTGRWHSTKSYLDSATAAQGLEIEQKQQLWRQNQIELENARKQLNTEQKILQEISQKNQITTATAKDSLVLEQEIFASLEPLVKEGAVSQVYYQRQAQEVKQSYQLFEQEKYQGLIQYEQQLQQIKNIRAEIAKLTAEGKRLKLDTLKSKEELISSKAASETELWEQIANNNQQVATINSQIAKNIVENKKRLAEVAGKMSSFQQELKYQQLKASSSGTVFDLQTSYQEVVKAGETVMKIVPESKLVAEVFIPNKDIGFIQPGMPVSVRVETFSFSEFGDIKGEVISIGSDALPPNETHPFYRFPAKIKLTEQVINYKGNQLSLRSGMSISASIMIDTDRKVISLFVDLFDKKIDALKRVR